MTVAMTVTVATDVAAVTAMAAVDDHRSRRERLLDTSTVATSSDLGEDPMRRQTMANVKPGSVDPSD